MRYTVLVLLVPLWLVACGNGPALAQPETPTTRSVPAATATRCVTPTGQALAQATETAAGPAGTEIAGSGGTATGHVVQVTPGPRAAQTARLSPNNAPGDETETNPCP